MKQTLLDIKSCSICKNHLPHGINPILAASKNSKVAIIGQAPGRIVHETNVPWNDKSGERLRNWLGVTSEQFYNPELFALIPMGFCYPGTGKSGDLPPRKECAPQWHQQLFDEMPNLELVILIGTYAQKYYLKANSRKTLTETVKNFEEYLPEYMVLPHPSPRNNIWLKKNDWFEKELVGVLQVLVREQLKQQ
jgi:uracil-DNA glycosylase